MTSGQSAQRASPGAGMVVSWPSAGRYREIPAGDRRRRRPEGATPSRRRWSRRELNPGPIWIHMDFYERSLLIVLLGPRRHADERLTDPVV